MDTRRGRTDIVKGRSVGSAGNVLTTLSCSASGIFIICCDLTRPTITLLARTFQSTRTRRRREQYIPLVAFCLRHFLADFIICMCEFDFRQAQGESPHLDRGSRTFTAPPDVRELAQSLTPMVHVRRDGPALGRSIARDSRGTQAN